MDSCSNLSVDDESKQICREKNDVLTDHLISTNFQICSFEIGEDEEALPCPQRQIETQASRKAQRRMYALLTSRNDNGNLEGEWTNVVVSTVPSCLALK